MAHVNAETLHALLDGSLAGEHRQAVQAHVAGCAQCSAHLAATRRVLDEATRIAAAVRGERANAGAAGSPPRMQPDPPPSRPPRGLSEPIVLIPPPPEAPSYNYPRRPAARGRRGLVTLAVIVLGFGAGFGMMRARVVTPKAEDMGLDLGSLPAAAQSQPVAAALTPLPAPPPAAAAAPDSVVPRRDTVSSIELAARQPVETDTAPSRPRDRTPAPVQQARPQAPPPEPRQRVAPADSTVERRSRLAAAAAATEELDRRLVRERAAEATARIDRMRPPPALDTAPAPEPEPYSIDKEVGLQRRLGLDEVGKYLGEAMHVIDGLRPQVVGLVHGKDVPGADEALPVVRVVYSTPSGGLVMLDQQRVRTLEGDRPELSGAQGGRRWIKGDVLIYLHGRASPAELSDLASRVR